MAVELDNLEIKIQSSADQAANGIKSLSEVLQGLKSVTRGGAGLATVSKQLATLNSSLSGIAINTGKIGAVAAALNSLADVKKASGLTSTVNTLKKLPEITDALGKMDLSRFATQMTRVANSVRPLATEMQRVSKGFAAFPIRIQKIITSNAGLAASNTNAGKSFGFLGTGISSAKAKMGIYAVLLRRVSSVMAGWAQQSNKYVEDLNLFTVAMGDGAQTAYDYAQTVREALGIDPAEWMRNQGVFKRITAGFGVVEEKANLMSKNLTQIGYDISSFFNISIEDAMQKVQSGIAGELEPLRRLGYALDVATLQEIAYNNGIKQKVNTMNQAQKSQLRYLAIMEQSGNVMGDMARTIITPANAMRVLQQQVTQLTRALGNMLIPVILQVLPYVQAFVVVLTDAINRIASLMGFELPKIDYSGLSSGASDVSDSIGDIGDSADKAGKAIKKSFATGIDELNILNDSASRAAAGVGGIEGGNWEIDLPQYDFLKGFQAKTTEALQKIKTFLKGIENSTAIKALGDAFSFLWNKAIKPFGNWVLKHPNDIVNFITAIGAAILTYKLATTIGKIAGAIIGGGGLLGALKGLSGILTHPWALAIAAVAASLALVFLTIKDRFERKVMEDIADRFGDISLSMEEVKEVAESLTTSDLSIKIDLYYTENAKLDELKTEIDNNVRELQKYNWMVGIGMQLDEGEQEDYKAKIDGFVKSAQDYVVQRHYVMSIAVDTLLENTTVGIDLQDFVNTYMSQSEDELQRLGKQLRETVDNAFADGILDPKEMETIVNLQTEMKQIVEKVADAEYAAKMKALRMDCKGTDLTFESWSAVMEEANTIIAEQMDKLDDVRLEDIKIAELKLAEDGDRAAYDAAMKEIEKEFQKKKLLLNFDTFEFGMDTLRDAYGEELFDRIPELSGITQNAISVAFDRAKDDPNGFDVENFVSSVGVSLTGEFKNLEPEVQESFKRVVEYMKPTYEQMADIAQKCREAGISVPQEISEGLRDLAMLQAMAGDTSALYDVLGDAINDSPEKLALFESLDALGVSVPKELADQILSHSYTVENSAKAMAAQTFKGAQSGMAEDAQKWDALAQMPLKTFNTVNSVERWKNVGQDIVSGIRKGVENVGNVGVELAQKLMQGVRSQPGIDSHSPSKAFAKIGQDSVAGLSVGLAKVYDTGVAVGRRLVEGVKNTMPLMRSAADELADVVQKSFDGISYDPGVDYMARIQEAVNAGDWEEAGRLEVIRNAKIDGESLGDIWSKTYDFTEALQPATDALSTSNEYLSNITGSALALNEFNTGEAGKAEKRFSELVDMFTGWNKAYAMQFSQFIEVVKGLALDVITAIREAAARIVASTDQIRINVYNTYSMEGFASGGMPKSGQMFIAREAGAEMVGAVGRRTAVANNDQIVSGIRAGVEDANEEQNALLREQNGLLCELIASTGNVYLDGTRLAKSVEKAKRESGASIMKGGVLASV